MEGWGRASGGRKEKKEKKEEEEKKKPLTRENESNPCSQV